MNTENQLIAHRSSLATALPVPSPKETIDIRLGNTGDIGFIDELQKQYSKNLGFMPKLWLENKIKAEHILIAEVGCVSDAPMGGASEMHPTRVGYIIAQDRYLKRDELGIVYQLVVSPGKQRSFIGAALLKAQFDRSQYGCRLYCCWCAQDLEANHFWEAMGFYPLAYRNGAEKKGRDGKSRVQIFWEKKIRGKDDAVNWWFPAKTEAGAMNADRLALPIPPGVHWSEVEPIEVPLQGAVIGAEKQLEGDCPQSPRSSASARPRSKVKIERAPLMGGLRFAQPKPVEEAKIEVKKQRVKKPKIKLDPKFIAASRELRDRYLEEVNENGFKLESVGKYELVRNTPHPSLSQKERGNAKLLAA